jgi:hypothetical protein
MHNAIFISTNGDAAYEISLALGRTGKLFSFSQRTELVRRVAGQQHIMKSLFRI